MNPRRLLLAAASLALAGLVLIVGANASAVVDSTNPCNVEGWFVNPDEADREPERMVAGFVFENTDLIHHNAPAGLTTATLSNGDFHATPLPDQDSFFSVEVSGDDGGYATLRWNVKSKLWEMTTGGQFYTNSNPDLLVDMPPVKRSHKVVRFGVGYTKTPPGTVKTVVRSVAFQGTAYKLHCEVKPSPSTSSPSPSTSTSTSSSPSPSGSISATATPSSSVSATTSSSPSSTTEAPTPLPSQSNAAGGGDLPVTGTSLGGIIAGGVLVLGLGIGTVLAARRRRRA